MTANNFCPLCNCTKLSVVLSTHKFKIIVCKNCKIAFTDPEPIIPAYEEMDFHSKNDAENTDKLTCVNDLPYDWKRLIDLQVGQITNTSDKEDAILEIGCGEGILLGEVQKKGFKNLSGFEPSKTAAMRARKRNLIVVNDYFSPSKVEQKYDLVIMSHVFEHIKDPVSFIKQISTVLNKGGNLMLTQTNYKGLIPLLQREKWYAWVPDQHFWHFTPESLKIIFEKTGFEIREVTYSSLVHPHDLKYKIAGKIPKLQDQFIIFSTKLSNI